MNIAIDGTSGSGKGTLAQKLVDSLDMTGPFSAGIILRSMARERNVTLEQFQEIAKKDAQFDVKLDKEMRRKSLEETSAVFDGRLTAFFCHTQVRIYLDCPLDVRAARVTGRDTKDFTSAKKDLAFRDENNAKRYRAYYGIIMGDPKQYNIFLSSEHLSPDDLAQKIITEITQHAEKYLMYNDRIVKTVLL